MSEPTSGGSGTSEPRGPIGGASAGAVGDPAPLEHEVVPQIGVDESFQVETHGINPIPVGDRHGSPRELFWVWMGSNIIFTYVIFGAILVSFGVSLTGAFAAVVVGNLLYFLVGLGGIAGPSTGTATLVISRAPFGVLGAIPSALLAWLNVVGFAAVNAVIGTLALYELAQKGGLSGSTPLKAVCLAVVLLVTFVGAYWGHATVVTLQRWFTYALGVGTVLLAAFVLPKLDTDGMLAPPPGVSHVGAWLLAVFLIASGPLSYMASPADYTRYFRPGASSRAIVLWTAFGALIPTLILTTVGIAAATATDMTDSVAGVTSLVPDWFGIPFLALIVGGTITNNLIGLYSSGLILQMMGVRLPRSRTVFIDAAVATVASIYAVFVSDFTTTFTQFLSLLVIWASPWCAIYLTDILMRRNTYDNVALHQWSRGAYSYTQGFNIPGMVALVLGMVVGGLFANSTHWQGPFISNIGGGDLSVESGFLVGAVTYFLLMRSRIQRSTEQLRHSPSNVETGTDAR
jgi:nucleobase:cation symporter-1, NCS1 family